MKTPLQHFDEYWEKCGRSADGVSVRSCRDIFVEQITEAIAEARAEERTNIRSVLINLGYGFLSLQIGLIPTPDQSPPAAPSLEKRVETLTKELFEWKLTVAKLCDRITKIEEWRTK